MSEVDEALVEEVARVIERTGPDWPHGYSDAARCIVVHLADAHRLITGEVEEREEWGRRWPNGREDALGADEVVARSMTDRAVRLLRRTVRTWRTPDGTVTTQVGPWREVD